MILNLKAISPNLTTSNLLLNFFKVRIAPSSRRFAAPGVPMVHIKSTNLSIRVFQTGTLATSGNHAFTLSAVFPDGTSSVSTPIAPAPALGLSNIYSPCISTTSSPRYANVSVLPALTFAPIISVQRSIYTPIWANIFDIDNVVSGPQAI